MPRELWKLDFVKEFNSYPRVPLMAPPRPCSIGVSLFRHFETTVAEVR